MKKAAGALSIDDVISSDITISRKLSAVVKRSARDEATSYKKYPVAVQPAVDSADGSCNDGFSRSAKTKEFSRGAKMKKRSAGMMRTSWYIKMVQLVPVGSDSTSRRKQQLIQSRASMNQLLLCIQSQDVVPVTSKLQRYESSRSDEPAAKGLYTSRSAIEDKAGETVGRCEAVAENTLIAQCTSRGKMNRKTKQSTAIREELSRESIAEF
ncbi:RNA-binding protein FUS-like [Dorcoceras hygrometricum]|uniref:RNA-binding protein FUS-like n=1 Tax=Dorcoceras hygrometricum TaxID=472368 RepID=A0A2Z7CS18_9LAMI|nr:RNA-binding protein FUS-like [Dorcoceras hygrometricum]